MMKRGVLVTNQQIFDAQKVLSKWRGTPVKMLEEHGQVFWQITFDNETYGKMLSVVSAVADLPIQETYTTTYTPQRNYQKSSHAYINTYNPEAEYHRDKI